MPSYQECTQTSLIEARRIFDGVRGEYDLQHGRSEGTQTNVVIKLNKLLDGLEGIAAVGSDENRDSFPGMLLEFTILVGALRVYQVAKKSMAGQPREWKNRKPFLKIDLGKTEKLANEEGMEDIQKKKALRLRQEGEMRQAAERVVIASAAAIKKRDSLVMLTWPNVQRIRGEREERERRAIGVSDLQRLTKMKPQLELQRLSLEQRLREVNPNRISSERAVSMALANPARVRDQHAIDQVTMHLSRVQEFDMEESKLRNQLADVKRDLQYCVEAEQELREL